MRFEFDSDYLAEKLGLSHCPVVVVGFSITGGDCDDPEFEIDELFDKNTGKDLEIEDLGPDGNLILERISRQCQDEFFEWAMGRAESWSEGDR